MWCCWLFSSVAWHGSNQFEAVSFSLFPDAKVLDYIIGKKIERLFLANIFVVLRLQK